MAKPDGMTLEEFVAWNAGFRGIKRSAHETATRNGFWETARNDGELIALMHSELSEALEALRQSSSWRPVEEELADVIIRIADYAEARQIDVGGAVLRKLRANQKRGYKHGGKAF